MTQNADDIDALVQAYLQVCNRALAQHKDQFPYKQIWEAVEHVQQADGVDLTVYDDRPQSHVKVRLKDKQIEVLGVDHEEEGHRGFKLTTSYLKRVVEQPEEYINHPAKLDWDWLKSRF